MGNPLCHFELMTNDPEKCKAFYKRVFDWELDDESMPGYTLVRTGSEPTGGLFAKPPEAPCACMNVYYQVDDLDDALARAIEGGATVLVGKTPIRNVGYFAMFADPEGIAIGLMQPNR